MNKNDLRFQKTEIAIKDAYMKLKKHGSTVVRVKDLCDAAMINKTTFYTHYETVEHLHKAICNEFLSEVLDESNGVEQFEKDMRSGMLAILSSFQKHRSTTRKLYGDNLDEFVNDFEKLFLKSLLAGGHDEDYELAMRFCIGGAFRLLVNESNPARIEKTLTLVEMVMNGK
jgi:AcrR family transcriptional regulator